MLKLDAPPDSACLSLDDTERGHEPEDCELLLEF